MPGPVIVLLLVLALPAPGDDDLGGGSSSQFPVLLGLDGRGRPSPHVRTGLFLTCHVSLDDHLRIESSYSYRAKTATRDGMLKVSDSPGIFVRAVCVLCVALICVMGTVHATHSHPENSTTSHHSCSICATAHVGLNTQTVVSTPVIVTAALASPVAAVSLIFRPTSTQFIRPPPAL